MQGLFWIPALRSAAAGMTSFAAGLIMLQINTSATLWDDFVKADSGFFHPPNSRPTALGFDKTVRFLYKFSLEKNHLFRGLDYRNCQVGERIYAIAKRH